MGKCYQPHAPDEGTELREVSDLLKVTQLTRSNDQQWRPLVFQSLVSSQYIKPQGIYQGRRIITEELETHASVLEYKPKLCLTWGSPCSRGRPAQV